MQKPGLTTTNERVGKVYKITSPKGRIYIGSTFRKVEKRWSFYKNLTCKEQPIIYNSLVKYGPENHVFEVIWEGPVEDMLRMERILGEQYNVLDPKKGLNCALPGYDDKIAIYSEQSLTGRMKESLRKEVYMYDFYGNYIKSFPSTMIAAEYLNSESSEISDSCSDGRTTVKGYIFTYYKDSDYLKSHRGFSNRKSINAYDLSGKYLNNFKGVVHAGKELNVCRSEVYRVCINQSGQVKGFQFRYRKHKDDQDDISSFIKIENARRISIKVLDKDWNEMKTFTNISEIHDSGYEPEYWVYKSYQSDGAILTPNNRRYISAKKFIDNYQNILQSLN